MPSGLILRDILDRLNRMETVLTQTATLAAAVAVLQKEVEDRKTHTYQSWQAIVVSIASVAFGWLLAHGSKMLELAAPK